MSDGLNKVPGDDPSGDGALAREDIDLSDARVLLAEDSLDDVRIFRRHCAEITENNWQIDHATNYDEACAMIAEHTYDLCFFDYRLGASSGVELIHELQKIGATAPIILMTGVGNEKIGEEALIAGATDFLPKQELSPAVIHRVARYAIIRRNSERALQTRAQLDGLTGSFNRNYFVNLAQEELNRSQRFGLHVSLLMLDIDHFKQTNDLHGHAAGDMVLNAVVKCCRTTLRAVDLIGRFGGDEFLVLLPQTDLAGATVLAERIHNDMRRTKVLLGDTILKVTLSMGVASVAPPIKRDIHKLIEEADNALYKAKQNGRDRVEKASLT